MTEINLIKQLCRIVALVSAVGMIAVLAACGDDSLSAEEYMERARTQIAEQNLQAGVIELKNAVQKDPKWADARILLGETYLKLGDAASAEKELTRARDLGGAPAAITLPLANAWLAQLKFQKVLDEVSVDETASPARQAEVHLVRAKAHFGLKDPEAGKKELGAAHALDPDSSRVLVMLSGLALIEKDLDKAKALIERAKEVAPDDPDVLAQAGEVARARGDLAGVVAEYQALVNNNPDVQHYKLALAEAQINHGDLDPAIEALDAYLNRYPKQPYAHYLRGLAAYQKRDFEGAKQHAQLMVRAVPEYLPALLVLGGAHFGLGENEQAITYLKQFLASVPNHEPARRMLAAALLQTGDSNKAREVLAPLESKAADDAQLLAMIGTAALKSGDLESSKRYFERLTEVQPDNPAAWAQLGTIRAAMGDVEEGTLDLERSVEQDPTARSLTALALAHIRAREFDKALEVAAKLSEQFPENAAGAILSGVAYAGKDNLDQARVAFERALEIDPTATDASMNLAALRARADDFEGAHEILAKALEQAPENMRLLGRIAEVEARLGRIDDAKARLREMGRINPDAIGPKIVLARLLVGSGEPQKALDVAAGQLPLHPDNTALLDVVGQAYLAAGQPNKAAEILERLLELIPENAATLSRLAKAYESAGRPDLFKAYLEKVIKLRPDNALANMVLARMAFAEGDLPRAEALVANLEKLSADEPRVAELKGDIALKKKDIAAATTAYKDAFGKEPNSQRVIKLALAQKLAGDLGYRQMLDTWLVQHPDDPVPRLFVANDDIQAERYQAARKNYEKVVELVPDNVMARNNLAWLLWREGDAQAALPHAERALELAPDAATVQDTAGLVYLKLGNISRASTLLKEAAGGLPDNAEVQYHYAQALAAQGNSKEALDVLTRALSKGANFSERAEAEALLKELGG